MAIKCPKCHSDNTDTARFCSNCATSLAVPRAHGPSLTKTLQSPTYVVAPGTVIAGHYEVQEKLGQGGMGEVHRALDRNLGRHVAIKILPEEFSTDLERVARFEREAKLLATLNYPNIAAVYGFEEAKGLRFLVMELVEGETLQTRLDKGALSIDEALETCRQVAEGLEAAHERGVVHRDLKPGNIMITPEGKVKILDFGLAKAYTGESTGIDIANSPTITAQMTEPGVILGTAAYMSPEQARGRSVDKRADIWTFGCILYECLTGERAFHGETVSDTLAHILKGEPDWSRLPAETPTLIKVLLRRCLEKNPRERLHDVADARIEITEALGQPSAPEAVSIHRANRAWIIGGIIGGLVVGVVLSFVIWHPRPTPPLPVVRFPMKVGPGLWLSDGNPVALLQRPTRTAMAVSKDGSFIVYSAIAENPGPKATSQIYLRRMDRMDGAPVSGVERGWCLFLSPDDRWIGFKGDGKLRKVPVGGGTPTILYDMPTVPFGADWGPDNTIVFSADENSGLLRIPDVGGKPEVLTVPDKAREEYGHRLPHFLPGGRAILFTVAREGLDSHPSLDLLDLQTRKWRKLIEDAADGRYVRTGHVIFMRQGTMMAVAFDLDRLEVQGQPAPVVADVMQALNISDTTMNNATGQYSISDSGLLAYVPGGIFPERQDSLVRMDEKGNIQSVDDQKAGYTFPRLAPDGKKIVYQTFGMNKNVWIYDLSRGTHTPLAMGVGTTYYTVWTPDGKQIVFDRTTSGGTQNLYQVSEDGSSPMERLTTSNNNQCPESFNPDGSILAFVEQISEANMDILVLDMKRRRVTPFLTSEAVEMYPEFSPDGRWLAYCSNEIGTFEIWVRPFPGPGGRRRISTEGGMMPLWSKDGTKLFYADWWQSQARGVWVTDINTGEGFSAGKPRLLFRLPNRETVTGWPIRSWDLWPGQGFLTVLVKRIEPQPVTEIIVVQNWFEELKRLVPTGKK